MFSVQEKLNELLDSEGGISKRKVSNSLKSVFQVFGSFLMLVNSLKHSVAFGGS